MFVNRWVKNLKCPSTPPYNEDKFKERSTEPNKYKHIEPKEMALGKET